MSLVVGLTGGIGSGKTTAAACFAALGAGVVDTDAISHQLTQPGGAAISTIRQHFSESFLTREGGLNRKEMRELVFRDRDSRRKLEAILHPRIRDATAAEFGGAQPEPRLMIMGDFNSNEQNPAYRAALAAGLRSAYRVIDPNAADQSTFTGFKDTPELLTGVIDHILVDSRWKVIDAGIDMRKFGPLWPSDHFPVWSIVKYQ